MKTICTLTLKSALRDPYLLFWSLFFPIAGTIGLGSFIGAEGYPSRIMTGMMCASVVFYAYMTTVFSNLAQRRRGVFNLLHVTPLPLGKYVVSVSSAWTALSLLCSSAVLLAGMLVFQLRISVKSLPLLALAICAAAAGYIFFSFFISSLCKNEGVASLLSNVIVLPLLFCSDAFYSLGAAPGVMRALSRVNPFQFFLNAVRASLQLDAGPYLLALFQLALLILLTLPLAVRTFRYAER